jgi:hypothetical protein
VSSSDAVAIIVSVSIVFAFTGVMIWWMRKRLRLYRDLTQLLKDAEKKAARDQRSETDTAEPPSPRIE